MSQPDRPRPTTPAWAEQSRGEGQPALHTRIYIGTAISHQPAPSTHPHHTTHDLPCVCCVCKTNNNSNHEWDLDLSLSLSGRHSPGTLQQQNTQPGASPHTQHTQRCTQVDRSAAEPLPQGLAENNKMKLFLPYPNIGESVHTRIGPNSACSQVSLFLIHS